MVHHLTSGIETTFAPDCVLVLETARYCSNYIILYIHNRVLLLFVFLSLFRFMLDLKKEHKEEFSKKITGMAELLGFMASPKTGTSRLFLHKEFCKNNQQVEL